MLRAPSISSSAPCKPTATKLIKPPCFSMCVVLSSPSRTRRRLEQLSLDAACPHRVKSASSGTFGRHVCHHRATRFPCSDCQCSHSTFEQKCFANWAPCHSVVHCLDASLLPPPRHARPCSVCIAETCICASVVLRSHNPLHAQAVQICPTSSHPQADDDCSPASASKFGGADTLQFLNPSSHCRL